MVFAFGTTGATAAPTPSDTPFPGAVPSWAQPANSEGPAAADTTIEAEFYLSLRDQKGAEALATAVSTPGNRNYQNWLTPDAWINRFSPTKASYAGVVNYLKTAGMSITGTPDSRLYVVFRGTVAQLDAAFGAQLTSYNFHGTTLVGPSQVPSLPAAVAASVAGISVDQGSLMTRPDYATPDGGAQPAPQARNQRPPTPSAACSNYYGQYADTVPTAYGKTSYPTYLCGYTPSQIQSAYGKNSINRDNGRGRGGDGAGQTVAIIDAYASPTILSDINTYSATYGLPQMTKNSYRQIVPDPSQFSDEEGCTGPSGWQPEQSIDVAAVHGTAPGANILYVGGFNCGGGLDIAMSKILDHKLANIVSNSYGNAGEGVSANTLAGEVNIQLQAAGEGVGLYFSSGDDGDEAINLGSISPDFPASSPWVTAVGGTSLAVAKNGSYQSETGWGDARNQIVNGAYVDPLPGTFRFGAGGGISAFFAQPAYQKGIVPNSLAKGMRVSPDVSSVADPYTGYVIGISPINDDTTLTTDPFTVQTYGGTSLACPLTAGQMAVAQQLSGQTLGFANPAIYAASREGRSGPTDVVSPRSQQALAFTSPSTGFQYLVSLNLDTSLFTAKGYDDVTGLGSMNYPFALAVAQQANQGHGGGHH